MAIAIAATLEHIPTRSSQPVFHQKKSGLLFETTENQNNEFFYI
jgi:hypothetical protein